MIWNSKIFEGLQTGVEIIKKKLKLKKANKGSASAKVEAYKWKPACHSGDNLVFKVGKLSVFAGGWSRGGDGSGMDLIIDLAKDREPTVKIVGQLKGFDNTLAADDFIPMMVINWRDFGIPNLSKKFWDEIVKSLKNASKDKEFKVLICCQGGHGRTGTMLSILAHYFNVNGDINPVSFIRDVYCKETVENSAQIKYIEQMCDITIPVSINGAKGVYLWDK